MKLTFLPRIALLLAMLNSLGAATLTITAPLDYQVVQRETRDKGTITLQGRVAGADVKELSIEARMVISGKAGNWESLKGTFAGDQFFATTISPAGGWHRLEVRVSDKNALIAQAAVEHVGVGEVFVVAGQSNSANHGEETQSSTSGMATTFDGERWQPCKDPQPGASGTGGSFLPPFGDAMSERLGVPIGFVACGTGATSVREWLPKGSKFPNPPTITNRVQQLSDGLWESKGEAYGRLVERMKQMGPHGLRAVLWHQGESDANQTDPARTLPGKLYREYLEKVIRESQAAIGWQVPWFVAQVSYHVPGDETSPDIRAAQASLWTDGIALAGPDTDALKGALRDMGGKGVHFSGAGLRAHAASWVEKVAPWLEESVGITPLLVVQDLTATTNLLPNASFENASDAGVQDWKHRAWGGETECEWSVESPGRTGTRCVTIRSEKGSDAAWTATVPVKPNTFYRLSGWIKTKAVRGATGALLNIQNLQQVRTPAVRGTKDWTQVSTIFRSGDLTLLEINCLFGGWGSSTGQAWYDDLALEPLPDSSTEEPRAVVTIDADAPSIPYSPMLFGGFIEHFVGQIYGGIFEPGSPLSDERGYRKDVIAALKELKLSIVRWPGGCFASGYHWKDGVGETRTPVPDPVWGLTDPNTFGTDEFIEWCRLVGCEPYICSNAGNGTPEEMRDWVNYCNAKDRRSPAQRVRYWSIGNENWGAHEIGARTPQEWGPLVLRSANLMLAADPELTLIAAATSSWDWTMPLLNVAGKHLDYVAIHNYWLPCWGDNLTPDYLSCIMNATGPERTISQVIDILEEAGHRGRIKIAFDEWNLRGWHHPGFPRKQVCDTNDPAVAELIRARDKNAIPSQYSMADALFSASFLNACLRHAEDVGMANIAPIVNTRGPLFVYTNGIVKRTTFHVLSLYANELQSRVAKLTLQAEPLTHGSDFVPVVDAVATVDQENKTFALALCNLHPSKKVACEVKLGNNALAGTYVATVLSGDSPDAYNDIEHPTRVAPEKTQLTFQRGTVMLAPHSLTIVKIPGGPGR
jgi:alpha-N-arabinofuranosidase